MFAQLDRALTVKRLRDGHRAKAVAGGKASGSYPLGYTRDGEDDRKQAVLSAIRTLLQRGDTLDEVATYLNHRPNHHPRHAAHWTRQTVGAVVARAGLRAAPCGLRCEHGRTHGTGLAQDRRRRHRDQRGLWRAHWVGRRSDPP